MNATTHHTTLAGVACRQQGIALVIALVFLLLLTIIGVTAMQSATLQERMAGNVRDRNIGFQAGELALRNAEVWMRDNEIALTSNNLSESFLHEPNEGPDPEAVDCGTSGDVEVVQNVDGVAADPCYFIEDFSTTVPRFALADPVTMYRVTAIATGRSPDSRVVLRSTYRLLPPPG